ncbi:MAG: response regulator transcription factor, partial [Bacteroidota bacterium]
NKPEFIRNLINAGVNGYLLKNTGKAELLDAIRMVYNGEDYFSREVSKTLITSMKSNTSSQEPQLTKREKEVLKLIAKGLSTLEIAEILFVSKHTIDTHRKNLLGKLNIKNSVGLARYAINNGYTTEALD